MSTPNDIKHFLVASALRYHRIREHPAQRFMSSRHLRLTAAAPRRPGMLAIVPGVITVGTARAAVRFHPEWVARVVMVVGLVESFMNGISDSNY